jgi:hypothetical protein
MTKKHDMSDEEYEVYQRIYDYPHPEDVERGKIRREKASATRYRRRRDRHIKRQLRALVQQGDVAAWEDDATLDEYDLKARRELSNARTHKHRLKGIERHENQEPPPNSDD